MIDEENLPAELKDLSQDGTLEVTEGTMHETGSMTLEITNIDYDKGTGFLEIYTMSDEGIRNIFLIPDSGIRWMAEHDA